MGALVIFGLFFILLVFGIPIGSSIGTSAIFAIWKYNLGLDLISRNFAAGIAKFPLIAIPFFVLAGILMEKAKIAKKIADLATIIVGKSIGGLAVAGIVTAMFWGAVSGSGPATTAAIGLILIIPMINQGYDKYFSATTIAAASGLAIIIPPSIAYIVYGNVTGVSVGALFLGGIIPGLIIGLALIFAAIYVSKKRNYRGVEKRGSFKEIAKATKDAFWALLAPIIILGGIYMGIATPTEAAVIAVFYSLFVGLFVYKTLSFDDIMKALIGTTVTSSVVMFVVTFAGIFSLAATSLGVIDQVTNFVVSISHSKLVILFLVEIIVLIGGMFLDAISLTYVLMPILMPVLAIYHVDLLYFGILFTVALAIGQITPPVAVNLYVAANLINSSLDKLSKEVWKFVFAAVLGLVILTLLPKLSTFLPVLSGLHKVLP